MVKTHTQVVALLSHKQGQRLIRHMIRARSTFVVGKPHTFSNSNASTRQIQVARGTWFGLGRFHRDSMVTNTSSRHVAARCICGFCQCLCAPNIIDALFWLYSHTTTNFGVHDQTDGLHPLSHE